MRDEATNVIAVIAPGAMGSAVARRLGEHGVQVLTSVSGRSTATRTRAASAGMIEADDDQIAAADIILSMVPPAEAVSLAERLGAVIAKSGTKPLFVDCNAINDRTVKVVEATIASTGAHFVDGAIIGFPPKPGEIGPTFYFSGEAAPQLVVLSRLGLRARIIDGPIGAASALKMSYAGIAKGVTALGAAMVLAATRAGAAEALKVELAESLPQILDRLSVALPDMVPKAARWVAEMYEIAEFIGHDRGESGLFDAAALLFGRLADDFRQDGVEIGYIEKFLGRK